MTMKVTLTKDLEQFVEARVKRGGYADAGEVVRDALRHLRQSEEFEVVTSQELEAKLLEAVEGPHKKYSRKVLEDAAARVKTRVIA